MITLHRIGHPAEPFQLNPDSIVTVESTPDTVLTLTTASKVVVGETPEQVARAMRAWRVELLAQAIRAEHDAYWRESLDARDERRPAIEGLLAMADHRGR
jgi:flagellar protein FlbD